MIIKNKFNILKDKINYKKLKDLFDNCNDSQIKDLVNKLILKLQTNDEYIDLDDLQKENKLHEYRNDTDESLYIYDD